jgi:predicted aspartyl protease
MEIYRLSNRVVSEVQSSRLLSAKGALSASAWGNRPRGSNTAITSAEGALQSEGGDLLVLRVNRAFSAGGVLISQTLGRCPRLTMTLRRWHDRLLSEGTGFIFLMVQVIALFFAIAPFPIFAAAENLSPAQLPGYKAVPVYYRPLNKMIMSVRINGQLANLLVDTGSNQLIIDAGAAERFGVKPSQRGLRYIRFTTIQGEDFPVGYAQSITAGSMNFGSSPVTLRKSPYSGPANANVDGVLGLDLLLRHKAVINFRTKLLFFKVDQTRQTNLGAIAASEKFSSVPIRREENGALTVPCSVHGQPGRLILDTGAFVTALNESFVNSLGIASAPTPMYAHFPNGLAKQISAAKINDLKIGNFKVPPGKFGTTALPRFALQQGSSRMAGILGVDKLYICHAIVDLDGMRLFLK